MKFSQFCLITLAALYSVTAFSAYNITSFEISGDEISGSGVWVTPPAAGLTCVPKPHIWYPLDCGAYLAVIPSPPIPKWMPMLAVKAGFMYGETNTQAMWEKHKSKIDGPFGVKMPTPLPPGTTLCLQFITTLVQYPGNSQPPSRNSYPMAGEPCVPAKATASCMVATSLTIDHGTVAIPRVDGHSASTPLTFFCSGPTNITIRPALPIMMSGNLASSLFVDNQDVAKGVSLRTEAGVTTFDIESRLLALGKVTAGASTGSGVLIIEYN
ncbi:hypothetical protein [Serratia sp. ASV30]|uniref:MrpH family fimbial adhesin n=1 Tax=Serratia sp. ASV30 TaxID=2795127 RepID=UPI0018EA53E1|nr:hypothetical protein [Serratia sp. ASV30]